MALKIWPLLLGQEQRNDLGVDMLLLWATFFAGKEGILSKLPKISNSPQRILLWIHSHHMGNASQHEGEGQLWEDRPCTELKV